MPIAVRDFLKAHQIDFHPFQYTNAEQEQESLASYFIHVPWFDQLSGDPTHPESLILFAPQGHGKTSHRLEVARTAGTPHPKTPFALVVTFTDFDLVLTDAQTQPLEICYRVLLRERTLHALDTHLQRNPKFEEKLKRDKALYLRFLSLLNEYVPLRALDRDTTTDEVSRIQQAFRQHDPTMSMKDWLHELSRLARTAGCASIYCLIDGVDETSQTRSNPEQAAHLLSPLLNAPGILQECGYAFKFFLPDYLEDVLLQQQVGRFDRLPAYRLEWTDAELLAMMSRRLERYSNATRYASKSGTVKKFSDLCQPTSTDLDGMLIQQARTSPRKLIDLARRIVDEHCQLADTVQPASLISEHTVRRVLAVQNTGAPPDPPAAPAHLPPPTAEPGIAPLWLDSYGRIWIGDECRADVDSLSKKLRVCMDYLWQNRHRTITYAALQQALYGEADTPIRADTKDSSRKIVERLRDIIEPEEKNSKTYIAVQDGIGYVLKNCADPPDLAREAEYPPNIHESSS